MSGKVDEKEKNSVGDLNDQQNADKKNKDSESNTQTNNNEKTEEEDAAKQTNGKNGSEDHSDKPKNGKKSDSDKNVKRKKDSKTDKDQSEGKKDGEKKSSKEKSGKSKSKSHSSKHKKSRSVTFNGEVRHSPLCGGFAKKAQDVGGILQRKTSHIQSKKPIDWSRYRDSNAITEEEYTFINTLQYSNTKDERDELLQESKENAYHAIAKIIDCVQSVKEMQKLLILIHDFFSEDFARVELMNEATPKVIDSIQYLLTNSDDTIRHIASQVLTKLLFAPNGRPEAEDIDYFLRWLNEGLDENNPYLESVATCLQKLLQVDDYRLAFVEMDGIKRIIRLLTRNLKMQIQYQLCFCLWVSTFNADIAEKMNRTNMIPIVMDLLERCPSEITKLPRVVMALIRNILEKPQSEEIRRHNAMLSIQCKILQYLELLEPKIKNINDPELSQDFEEIRNILSTTVMEASSFEEYLTEVRSGHLIWSVVHTSQNFWVDNAERLNDNDYELLKTLISFLEESDDSVVLCIAAHDLGEYMKQYIRGKTMVENLGGKEALIKLLECTNQGVKYQALKCLQMLMLDKHDLYSEFQTNNRKIAEMCCIDEE